MIAAIITFIIVFGLGFYLISGKDYVVIRRHHISTNYKYKFPITILAFATAIGCWLIHGYIDSISITIIRDYKTDTIKLSSTFIAVAISVGIVIGFLILIIFTNTDLVVGFGALLFFEILALVTYFTGFFVNFVNSYWWEDIIYLALWPIILFIILKSIFIFFSKRIEWQAQFSENYRERLKRECEEASIRISKEVSEFFDKREKEIKLEKNSSEK